MVDGMIIHGGATPSQTAGPFVSLGTEWAAGARMVSEGAPGAIVVTGTVVDGANLPITDAMLEFFQADAQGRFPPAAPAPWTGFTRALTMDGSYRVVTVKPGPLGDPGGPAQAPHIDVSIFARGLLQRLVTCIYFSDEEANLVDPVLNGLGPELGRRLVAQRVEGTGGGGDGLPVYRLDIHLQGEEETVFFAP